jgi:hypothetical protein
MLVKCEKCGYENFPQHRFCGMCGAALAVPKAAAAQPNPAPPQAPKPVSRSSPAALDHGPVDPKSVSYLLEDEPPPSHRGRNVLLFVVLAGAVAAAGWHWREDLGGLAARFSSPGTDSGAQPNSSTPAAADSTAETTSATSAGTPIDKPGTGASAQGDAPAPATQTQAAPAAEPSNQSQASDSGATAAVPKPDESGEASASQPALAVAPPKVRAQRATASAAGIGDLEAEGEKYLYGNGVAENCARARRNLLVAAQRSNAKAENVLGTMYATGHCAKRDLPTAYRWFGRSLQKDPGNTRIQEDLKVLWNQMTPEEQKLALRGER